MITWTITQTDYQTANGFIFTAHWTATQVAEIQSLRARVAQLETKGV